MYPFKGCGIYTIGVRGTDFIYVGQSRNIYNRLKSHHCSLKAGKAKSRELQKHFDVIGWEGLKIRVIEYCSVEDLDETEEKVALAFHALGYRLLNHTVHTQVTQINVPRVFSDSILRLVILMDQNYMNAQDVEDFMDEKITELENRL